MRALKRAGWNEHHQRGSHLYLRHEGRPGVQLTVPIHRGRDLLPGTLASILDRAGLSIEQLIELM